MVSGGGVFPKMHFKGFLQALKKFWCPPHIKILEGY
jgi:hypothetical protein